MRVTVKGVVMEVVKDIKDGVERRTARVYQQGEKELVSIRLGDGVEVSEGEVVAITGRLVIWRQRDGVGCMVMGEELGMA